MIDSALRGINGADAGHATSLWVDDHPPEIERFCRMLNDHGVFVSTVASSAEAKAEVRKRPYDLMLIDLRLDEEDDGIGVARYARQLMGNQYGRSIHFAAVTNFKDTYGEEAQKELFTFVYEKDELVNGKSKVFIEDCLFAAADSKVRGDYSGLTKNPPLDFAKPDSVVHVRCDIGYVLRMDGSNVWARLWRRGTPGERAIRVFDRSDLAKQGVSGKGQPFRIDTYKSKVGNAHATLITPLHESGDRSRQRVAKEIDLERFRKKTGE